MWSSFPGLHKRRFYQGLGLYVLAIAATASWVTIRSEETLKEWNGRIPSASAAVNVVYLSQPTAVSSTDPADTSADTPPVSTEAIPLPDGKARIAIVMTDLGLSAENTRRALEDLPAKVTLAFSPYADNPSSWIQQALQKGRETLIQLPMEAATYPTDDPGPKALSSRNSDQDNAANLKWILTQSKGVTGVINLMGSRFLADTKRLPTLFDALKKNDLMFIETPGIEKSAGAKSAQQTNLPYLSSDIKIDAVAIDTHIQQQLKALEKAALEKGYAVGIAEPYPVTMDALKIWAAGLNSRGIVLAPVKAVWKNKPHHEEQQEQPTAAPAQELLERP